MLETKRCPQCQTEIPASAPEGLCPQCLLQAAMPQQDAAEPESTTAAYAASASAFVPPAPETLKAAFPHLEILELLGKGGMGAVYKARQPSLDRQVAVKILPPEISQDPAFAERFAREARALARLSHPNIVAVYDFGQAGEYCYIVMEYVEGVNLRQAIRAKTLQPVEALKIVPQICDALQFAHDEGVVHRDIKPENILLDKKGRVKIADFGLAKLLGKTNTEVSLTGSRQVMGTLHYIAPEQLEGSPDVDHRADIYSLGVTFYEMLTGELPIGRFAPPSKKVQLDVRLDEVVLRSLEREPQQRYQNASEIRTEMETIAREPDAVHSESMLAAVTTRPWLVPVQGAVNVFFSVIVLFMIAGDFLSLDEIPPQIAADARMKQIYEIWRIGEGVTGYLATLAAFAAGIGLMMWKPWARRLTVATLLFMLGAFVLEIPALIAFVIQPAFAEAPEVAGPDPAHQMAYMVTLFMVLFGMMLVGLIYQIAVLVYLTRPRIVAAFEQHDEPSLQRRHTHETTAVLQ